MQKKWLHIIGVCGKTTANIAKEFQNMGWFVTGSDNQYLPPASDLLVENKINTVVGFDFEHLTKSFWLNNDKYQISNVKIPNDPDLILFISHLPTKNKEYLYAKKKGLDIRPYSRILKEYLIKDESIVVIGTAGKTTTTALITFLSQKLGLNPSYMIGADVVDIEDSLKITDSKWSVIEGDEYHNPDKEIEGKAKFLEYKPKYLIITKITWEHFDIFPTEELYVEEFRKAVELVPEDGVIIAKSGDKNIDKVLKSAKCKVIRYKFNEEMKELKNEGWSVASEGDENLICNEKGSEILRFKTELLGSYNLENILAAVILICSLPAHRLPQSLVEKGTQTLKDLSKYISEFHGVKKRLEHIYKFEDLIVIDDFGIAPDRAQNSLETIHEKYPEHKIISIFEPNAGSRPNDLEIFRKAYSDSFALSDLVIIPDLSEVTPGLVSTNDMVERLVKMSINTVHIENTELVSFLKSEIKKRKEKLIIVFFSSYKLTGVEEELVRLLNRL
ncbi:MAG: Mur ligase family protein [Candidatus Dojkabacteria bacterium]